ncbi:MAG: hypothetical protein Q8O51_00525 [bacterium]|nr:hypothetical protein [bacterium]
MQNQEGQFTEGEDSETSSVFEQEPNELRDQFWKVIESQARDVIDQRAPRLKEHEHQSLTDRKGHTIASVERLRQIQENEAGSQDIWLVLDFDDVLNNSTKYQSDLQDKLTESTGIPKERLSELYTASKIEKDGREVFHFESFMKAVQEIAPEKRAEIDHVISTINYGEYTNTAVEKAVLAARATSDRAMRVSLLTFGDPEYQRRRIFATQTPELVDEIIFTEGSKRRVLEHELIHTYGQNLEWHDDVVERDDIAVIPYNPPISEKKPVVLTIDDSHEQQRDYKRLLLDEGMIHARFRHPQAKRYAKVSYTEPFIRLDEDASHSAALELYRTIRIATESADTLKSKKYGQIFDIFGSAESRAKEYEKLGLQRNDVNVSYHVQGEDIIREADRMIQKDGQEMPQHVTQQINKRQGSEIDLRQVNFEEFISEKS